MKLKLFLIIVAVFIVSAIFFTCTQPNMTTGGGEVVSNTESGETILQVRIHDEPFKKSGKTVEELNITIARVDIIRSSDGAKITLSEEEQSMDILKISKSDPVVLSTVAVEPGQYEQLRLIIKDNATIKVDGEVFPITIPSGEQSGVKLKGPFTVPSGKLFRLDLDFKPEESVLLNKGQGYKMKPVIEISNTAEIVGIFRGTMEVASAIGNSETLIELRSDNSGRIKVSRYPDYEMTCNYSYNSLTKSIKMYNIDVDLPSDMPNFVKDKVKEKLPDNIYLPVKEWSLDSLVAIDVGGKTIKLYRVGTFDFSNSITYSHFTVTVVYPNPSMDGKAVLTEVYFDNGAPPLMDIKGIELSTAVHKFTVPDSNIMDSSVKINIVSYLFDSIDKLNFDVGKYGGDYMVGMRNSYYRESTENPWKAKNLYTLYRDNRKPSDSDNNFVVNFEKRLNIKMEHNNFTNDNPIVSWDKRDDAKHGYVVLVLVADREENPNGDDDDGSDVWDIAHSCRTYDNSVQIFSNKLTFNPVYDSDGERSEPTIKKGDLIRIEIFVLDGTKIFDTSKHLGALYMDSLNIIR